MYYLMKLISSNKCASETHLYVSSYQ